jgi:hypothetical protein
MQQRGIRQRVDRDGRADAKRKRDAASSRTA